jgi:quinol monooxygenase YgiN
MQWKNTRKVGIALVAAALATGTAWAQSSSPLYVVSYFEVVASSQLEASRPVPVDIFLDHQRSLAKEKGSVSSELLRDRGHPNHYTLIEAWTNQGAYTAYRASASAKQFTDAVGPWLAGPVDARAYASFP